MTARLSENRILLFEHIFRSTNTRVYGFVKKILRDDSVVQDCMQQCYMKVWEALDRIDTEKEILPLIYTYARNICIDHLRKNARYVWMDNLTGFSEEMNVENDATIRINQEQAELEVETLVKQMPPRRQQVFRLIRLQGFSYREVSDYLNISLSTVEKHMHEATKSLPKEMIVKLLICIFISREIK